MTLRETLEVKSYEDVHLVHDEEDSEPTTIVELKAKTLKKAGKEAWADVLDAEVIEEYEGIWGFQVMLRGAKARRIDEFSLMLSGNWSAKTYDLWVAQS